MYKTSIFFFEKQKPLFHSICYSNIYCIPAKICEPLQIIFQALGRFFLGARNVFCERLQ